MTNAELFTRFFAQGWKRKYLRDGPIFVTLFVTSKCNATCGHCFYTVKLEERKGKNELTTEEFRRISEGMPWFTKMLVSGGEPFIRTDLPEILHNFYRNNKVGQFTIPTNATFPERIEKGIDWLAARTPRAFLQLQLSIDGVGEHHDKIRGVPGNFEKLVDTYWRLRALQKRHDNVDIIFNMALTAYSYPYVREVCAFLDEELGTRQLHIGLIRGKPWEPETMNITPEQCDDALRTVEAYFGDGRGGRDRTSGAFARIFAARKSLTMERIVATRNAARPPPYQPCTAGVLNLVLDEQGYVYTCEILDKEVGNFRDVDYDFRRIWEGARLADLRKQILDTRCTCTHETNVSTNFYFTGASYPRLAARILGLDS